MALIAAATAALVSIGIGAAAAAVVAPVAVSLAGGIGLSILANALAPPEAVTQAGAAATGVEKEVSGSTVAQRTWIVGRVLTAGSHVYSQVSDIKANGDPHGGPERNRYYDVVHALADHRCSDFVKLHLNDEFPGGITLPTSGTMGSTIPALNRRGDDHGYLKWWDGASDQVADTRLIEASRQRDDFSFVWTSAHRLRGVAYIRCTFKYDERKFPDWPEFAAVIDGALLYDLRLDGSEGGTGTHRIADPATWAYSANPAVAIGHLLLGYEFDGIHHVGLQGTTFDMLDLDSFHQAANDCDDDVALNAGGTEKRYRCGFEFTTDLQNASIAETLLSSCAGRLCWTGARWRLFVGKAQTAVADITDDDIRIDQPREFDPKVGLADLVNRVTGQYTDPDEDWSVVAAQPRSSSEDQEEDGDRALPLDLPLHAVQSNTQAQRVMEIGRRQSREQKRHRIALPPKFLSLEVGDWISWTSARWGYVAKTFRIDNVETSHDLTVFLHLAECNANVFAWDETVDELGKTIKDLAPGGDPDDDINLALTPYTFVDQPDTKKAQVGIGVTWVDLDDRTVRTIELQWRRVGGSRVSTERVEADELVWETTKSIREDTDYEVRGRPRFKDGSYGDWTAWGPITSGVLFDAGTAPVPNIVSGGGSIEAITIDGPGGTERSGFKLTIVDPSDERVNGVVVQWKKADAAVSDAEEKVFKKYDIARIVEGVRSRRLYDIRAAFLFDGEYQGNWCTWVEDVSAIDSREDDTLITRDPRPFNGSFERLDPAGFAKGWQLTAGAATIVTDAAKAKHRRRCLSFTGSSTSTVDQTVDNYIDAEPGESWTISCWVSRSGTVLFDPGGGAFVLCRFYDKDDVFLGSASSILETITTTPEILAVESGPAPSGTAAVAIAIGQTARSSGSGELLFDRIKAVPQAESRDIRDDSIGEQKLKLAAVTTDKIAAGSVTTNKLADDAVETIKIKDANVTREKHATDAVGLVGQSSSSSSGTISATSFTAIFTASSVSVYKKTHFVARVTFRSNHDTNYAECEFALVVDDGSDTIIDRSDMVGSKNHAAGPPAETDDKVITLAGVFTASADTDTVDVRIDALKNTTFQNGRWVRPRITWHTTP